MTKTKPADKERELTMTEIKKSLLIVGKLYHDCYSGASKIGMWDTESEEELVEIAIRLRELKSSLLNKIGNAIRKK